LFEWALVTLITLILLGLFLTRIQDLLADAERVSLAQWEARMRNALNHEMSRQVVARRFDQIAMLDGINPIGLLPEPPGNYLGEANDPLLEELPSGVWVFDSFRQVLIYTVAHSAHYHSSLSGVPRSEYRVRLEYRDNNGNGRFDFKPDTLEALKLDHLGEYRWLPEQG